MLAAGERGRFATVPHPASSLIRGSRYTPPEQGESRVNGPQDGEGDNLWSRLRHRKVVQWGLAYAAGAWGLLQGLEYVTSTFDWPRQIQQLSTLALLIGLPIALVLAWYHGDKGHRRVTRTELAILTGLFLLGGGLFWRYQHTTASTTPIAATAAATSGAPTPAAAGPSIAVLPFENRSRVEDDVFFVDGIHDDILTQLSKVSALKVISRTSVEQFRDTKLPMKSIAEQLGVKSILEGGVQRAGERVRINVQLIDAGTDAHLWAETYDRALTAENIFAIQSELSVAIAGALKAALTPAEQVRVSAVPTRNLEAWEAYQLGKQRMSKRTSDGLADAERFFREAIELDPKFALAHVGLAEVLWLQIEYSGASSESALANAEKSVTEALRLQPTLSEAWACAGGIAMWKGSLDESESKFRRAIEINPNNTAARHWYSLLLRDTGRLDESLAQIERAVALDPLSSVMRDVLGSILEMKGRFREAKDAYHRAATIDPLQPGPYDSLAILIGYALGRPADAVPFAQKAMELDPDSPRYVATLALLRFDLGDDGDATRLLTAARQLGSDHFLVLTISAVLNLIRGDQQGAVRDADRLLALVPRDGTGLMVLRNHDLQVDRPKQARARYAQAYPELLATPSPKMDRWTSSVAVDLALVLQKTGESERAKVLLDLAESLISTVPRLGIVGYGIADAQIHALRGDKAKALAALREAERAGWRGPFWRYYRDFDPALASIRNEPEFKAVFADIERDMARQRAELAKRPKDAPLDLGASVK